jgi:uncharacterized protein (DUF1697 family)
MSRIIALLRALNVGGTGKVAMADLKAMLADLGFEDVASYIASGNLVFTGDGRTTEALEPWLEAEAARSLGLANDWILRTPEDWRALIEANPFPEFARASPSRLLVTVFKAAVDPAGLAAVQAMATAGEQMALGDRALYICFPEGAGASKLANAAIEKRLGSRGTARNWNTLLKLAQMSGA